MAVLKPNRHSSIRSNVAHNSDKHGSFIEEARHRSCSGSGLHSATACPSGTQQDDGMLQAAFMGWGQIANGSLASHPDSDTPMRRRLDFEVRALVCNLHPGMTTVAGWCHLDVCLHEQMLCSCCAHKHGRRDRPAADKSVEMASLCRKGPGCKQRWVNTSARM